MNERNPIQNPLPGDTVRPCCDRVGDRRVLSVSICGVWYQRIRPGLKNQEGYCLRGTWVKWCRDNHVAVLVKNENP